MKIRVVTDHYENAHGHKPRGTGRWYFQVGEGEDMIVSIDGRYTDAKRRAVQLAKEHGETIVVVLP